VVMKILGGREIKKITFSLRQGERTIGQEDL
jgi:hypothetical protein